MHNISKLWQRFQFPAVILLLIIGLVYLRFTPNYFADSMRLKGGDAMQYSMPREASQDIVLMNLGEKDAEKYGQWPWSRKDLGAIVQRLREAGAGTIVFPVIFAEKDRAGTDEAFIKAIKDNGVVVAQQATTQEKSPAAVTRGISVLGDLDLDYIYQWPGAVAPIPDIARSAAGVGVIASAPEIDGVVRKIPLVVRIGDKLYPSLALETIRSITGDPSYQMKGSAAGVEALRIPGFNKIPTDANGQVWIKWNNTFDTVSATDKNLNKIVKNKIVIIGPTMEGTSNLVATPLGAKHGHEVQANVLQAVVKGNSLNRPYWADLLEVALTIALSISVLYATKKYNVYSAIPIYVAGVALIYSASWLAFGYLNLVIDWTWPIFTVTVLFGYTLYHNVIREFRAKQQIKKQFGTYLSPDMVEKLQKNPDLLKLGGDQRELSIMFTDVRGFTTISEHYKSSPQGLVTLMNRYMTAMTASILEEKGTLDKYIGDAQMAFWNAPLDTPEHAKHATRAALKMLKNLESFNEELDKEGVPRMGMGIGINTGTVVVGNMGSDQRFDYTCLGDAVNLASRLEGQSKPYHVGIIVGTDTAHQIQDDYAVVELDLLAVKGKTEGVRIFTVLGENSDICERFDMDEHHELHEKMLDQYRAQKWTAAKSSCKALKGKLDSELDEYYDMMIERIDELREADLGEDWDGVFRTNSK
jgi:adenylate cyclase